jgi:hypothetical protein
MSILFFRVFSRCNTAIFLLHINYPAAKSGAGRNSFAKNAYLSYCRTRNSPQTNRRISDMLKPALLALTLAPFLSVLPTISSAGPSCQPRAAQTYSCAEGSVWDGATGGCVKQVGS